MNYMPDLQTPELRESPREAAAEVRNRAAKHPKRDWINFQLDRLLDVIRDAQSEDNPITRRERRTVSTAVARIWFLLGRVSGASNRNLTYDNREILTLLDLLEVYLGMDNEDDADEE